MQASFDKLYYSTSYGFCQFLIKGKAMNVTLLFLFSSLAALSGRVFAKLSSNIVAGTSRAKYALYFTVNGTVACLFFLLSGGFKLSFNVPTLIYSVLYALIVTVSLVSNTIIYKLASISDVNIIVSSTGLIGSAFIGYLVFKESIGINTVIKICIMLVTIVLIFFENKKKTGNDEKKQTGNHFLKIIVFTALVFVALSNSLIIKAFSVSENVTDSNSFFFLTNLILIAGAVTVYIVESVKNHEGFKDSLSLLSPANLFSLAGNTVFSNIGTLISVLIMAQIPLSLYSPLSSALGVLIAVAASLIFRERLGKLSYVAAILAICAVII